MKTVMYLSLTVIVMLVFLSVHSDCYAQEPDIKEQVDLRIKALDKELNLNDTQAEQIRKIYTDAMERFGQRSGTRSGGTAMFGGVLGRFGKMDSQIEAVLTPDQVKQYRAFILKQQVDTRMTRLNETLALTKDQEAKIRNIIVQDVQKTNEIFAEMRGSGADLQAMMGKVRDQRDATNKAIEALLTQEQV
ncbi:MAG TPA: hypothetical protein VMZ04_05615, partial [Anaerolineae bacterium]|nr:hypothetical protein [Anaerolineae bacterium]